MTLSEKKYQELLNTESDINLHLPTIRKYVSKGDLVLELGVRSCVSTWALLVNNPKEIVSVDVEMPPSKNLQEVTDAAGEIGCSFKFVQADSTTVSIKRSIDVLFVDTLHLYSHLVKELWRHSDKVRKYIIFHDFGIPEVHACIEDFLYNEDWKLEEVNHEGTKLAVLKRINKKITI